MSEQSVADVGSQLGFNFSDAWLEEEIEDSTDSSDDFYVEGGGVESSVDENAEDSESALYEEMVSKYLNLILAQLFDDVECILLDNKLDVFLDLSKQIHRLGNLLHFYGYGQCLPLLSYLSTLLPLGYEERDIGEISSLQLREGDIEQFYGDLREFLNCVSYILRFMGDVVHIEEVTSYEKRLDEVRGVLSMELGRPSTFAPLPVSGVGKRTELSSRTLRKLVVSLERLLRAAIYYVESSLSYGRHGGFEDVSRSFRHAAQLLLEHGFEELSLRYQDVSDLFEASEGMGLISRRIFDLFMEVCRLSVLEFPEIELSEVIREFHSQYRSFGEGLVERESVFEFEIHWQLFKSESDPLIRRLFYDDLLLDSAHVKLYNLSEKYHISTLIGVFSGLMNYWQVHTALCREAFISICGEILDLPLQGISDEDLRNQFSQRLEFLRYQQSNEKNLSPHVLVMMGQRLLKNLREHIDDVGGIDLVEVESLLVASRVVHCSSLRCLLQVLNHLLKALLEGEYYGEKLEGLKDSLYFCVQHFGNLLPMLSNRLETNGVQDDFGKIHLYYESLFSLYQIEGRSLAVVERFVWERYYYFEELFSRIWREDSSPTSMKYYMHLVKKLYYFSASLGLFEISSALVQHISSIPPHFTTIHSTRQSLKREFASILQNFRMQLPQLYNQALAVESIHYFRQLFYTCHSILSDSVGHENIRELMQKADHYLFGIGSQVLYCACLGLCYDFHELSRSFEVNEQSVEEYMYHLIGTMEVIGIDFREKRYRELIHSDFPVTMPLSLLSEHSMRLSQLKDVIRDDCLGGVQLAKILLTLRSKDDEYLFSPLSQLRHIVLNLSERLEILKKDVRVSYDLSIVKAGVESRDLSCELDKTSLGCLHGFMTAVQQLGELLCDHSFDAYCVEGSIEMLVRIDDGVEINGEIRYNGLRFTEKELKSMLESESLLCGKDDEALVLVMQNESLSRHYALSPKLMLIQSILSVVGGRLKLLTESDGRSLVQLFVPAKYRFIEGGD